MIVKPFTQVASLADVNRGMISILALFGKDVIAGLFGERRFQVVNPVGVDSTGLTGPVNCLGGHGGGSFLEFDKEKV